MLICSFEKKTYLIVGSANQTDKLFTLCLCLVQSLCLFVLFIAYTHNLRFNLFNLATNSPYENYRIYFLRNFITNHQNSKLECEFQFHKSIPMLCSMCILYHTLRMYQPNQTKPYNFKLKIHITIIQLSCEILLY